LKKLLIVYVIQSVIFLRIQSGVSLPVIGLLNVLIREKYKYIGLLEQ